MKKRELRGRIEECSFCDESSESYCDRHQGMVDELPTEYVVTCGSCGEVNLGVPQNAKVECLNCDNLLMAPKGEIHG